MCSVRLHCLEVHHLLSVAVVSADEENAVHLLNCFYSAAYASVNSLNCLDGCLENTCVADHVRVSEVDDYYIVLVRADSCVELLGNFGSAHLRLKVICSNCRRRNECTVLILVGFFDTAVEEECNVSILLCLSDTELLQAVCCKVFTKSVLDLFLLESNELVGDELVVILEAYICERHEAVSSL